MTFTLPSIIHEANRLAGFEPPTPPKEQGRAWADFLATPTDDMFPALVKDFALTLDDRAMFRDSAGHHVLNGAKPGLDLCTRHTYLVLRAVEARKQRFPDAAAFNVYFEFRRLAPYMRLNEHLAVALWVWAMGGVPSVPKGFFATTHQQALAALFLQRD